LAEKNTVDPVKLFIYFLHACPMSGTFDLWALSKEDPVDLNSKTTFNNLIKL
jgi:hypothetical protein